MSRFDYSTGRPRMPQFREADGRMDWRQIADMFIPGNVWNSRTNQYRPLGIASGVTGLPIEGAVAFGRGAGSFLQSIGRGGRNLFGGRGGDRTGLGPTLPRGPRFSGDFAGQDNWGTREPPSARVDGWQMPGTEERTRAERGESPIGLGQLGRGGDEAMLYYSQAMRNRNGALMER